ncbi:MAG TPA: hypothetical protein VFI94_01845 [Pseudolabrys sp.]|nr:hypothetical protein [Pseudolabrys sp.]
MVGSASVNGLLSTPLVLPAPVAGALAALFLVIVLMTVRRATHDGGTRLLLPFCAILIGTLAVIGIIDRLATNERMAEQRDLRLRDSQLSVSALAPGSPLACLDGVAGEQVENACERAVFADAQSTARAVAYVTARLALLADVSAVAPRDDRDLVAVFANARRAIELDRYGIAAHVLAVRDGCTTERCAAFAMFQDTGALKANLKVRAFETYVARYATAWGKSEPGADKEPQASAAPLPPVASAGEPSAPHPVDSRYDFPSAASIPPVSIMNAEPPPPKEQTGTASAQSGEKPAGNTPVPPKRPQAQAASPPAR